MRKSKDADVYMKKASTGYKRLLTIGTIHCL